MKKTYDFNIDGEVVELTADTPKTEAPKAKKDKRARRFCLTSYIDPSALRSFISKAPWVQHWAMCTHDRDKMEDGSSKETHTHVILYTYDAKTSSAIKKIFDRFSAEYYNGKGEAQNTLVQICKDVVAQWYYLVHKYDKEKAQYEPSARICDNTNYWLELCKTNALNDGSVNTGLQMFDDMLDGTSTREMIMRYGKEYIYHAQHFKQVVRDHCDESVREYELSEELARRSGFNILNTVDELATAVYGSFNADEIALFKKMLSLALNNVSVLENTDIIIRKD